MACKVAPAVNRSDIKSPKEHFISRRPSLTSITGLWGNNKQRVIPLSSDTDISADLPLSPVHRTKARRDAGDNRLVSTLPSTPQRKAVVRRHTFHSTSDDPLIMSPKPFPKIGRARSKGLTTIDGGLIEDSTVKATITCVAQEVLESVLMAEQAQYQLPEEYRCFHNEHTRFLRNQDADTQNQMPTLEHITNVFKEIVEVCQLEYGCILAALIYMDRLTEARTAFQLCSNNWAMTLCACSYLSAKVFDDDAMKMSDFAQVFGCSTGHLFLLEQKLLEAFNYNIGISVEDYNTYCDLLQQDDGNFNSEETPEPGKLTIPQQMKLLFGMLKQM